MHITLRRRPGLPSFRQQIVHAMVAAAIRRLNDARFQIVHYSIQTNHVHLVAEGADRDVVSRKMSGFAIAVAKRLNCQILRGRRGKVWSDRYYRRDIERAGEMHAVLRYVFGNAKHHGLIAADAIALDPYSSAWRFDGFDVGFPVRAGAEHVPRPTPRTRLLREDWRAWGLIPVAGAPGSTSRAPRGSRSSSIRPCPAREPARSASARVRSSSESTASSASSA
jgi:REP element-mobilizing transposase RayT